MEKPLAHGGQPEHEPEAPPKPTARDYALGTVVGALFAACVVVAAILSFDVNPAGPVAVVVAAIAGGSFSVRRVADYAFKAAAIGLVVGGVAAILLWPFFDVS
ncbi:MAG: hypothetical protein ACRDNG_06900 [Gaiellaceae bacterium]